MLTENGYTAYTCVCPGLQQQSYLISKGITEPNRHFRVALIFIGWNRKVTPEGIYPVSCGEPKASQEALII